MVSTQIRTGPVIVMLVAVLAFAVQPCLASGDAHAGGSGAVFPPPLSGYHDADLGVLETLRHRIAENPFNLVGTVTFALAIAHTFMTARFRKVSHRLESEHTARVASGNARLNSVSHRARLYHYLGEVEAVFGLWCIPLVISIGLLFDWATVVGYVSNTVNYTEPMFVVVIMVLASTRPILKLSEAFMNAVAVCFGGSLTAWWFTILTVGPLLGSFITEPASMTICALLLVRKFYELEPSTPLKYATLGLLFVNVSVGGTLTNFAAPPVLMVAEAWDWGITHMLLVFGWKAAAGILIANTIYWMVFRAEFASMRERHSVRSLKEAFLCRHMPREEVERVIDESIAGIAQDRGVLREEIARPVNRLTEEVRQRLWQRVWGRVDGSRVDDSVIIEAFEQRFEEIRLSRFRREIPHLLDPADRAPYEDPGWDRREDSVPVWVMLVHVVFMVWTVVNAHHPVFFVAGLLFFLGFATVTADYQNRINLRSPLLVGFFLGGLVTHGGVQGWWIEPVLGSMGDLPLTFAATGLTAFNDNAAITYLATLVPDFTAELKYAVVVGAVSGGGLTVIANAPNPAGQAILSEHFEDGISPGKLFKAALLPTAVMLAIFLALR